MKSSKLLAPIFLLGMLFSIQNLRAGTILTQKEDVEKVSVYYFHNTMRCATCNAVESVTLDALKENFGSRVADGTIQFLSLNLEEKEGKETAEKLNIGGQTLLFVSEKEQVNLTNFGFMNALTKPEKLKLRVKTTVEKLLK